MKKSILTLREFISSLINPPDPYYSNMDIMYRTVSKYINESSPQIRNTLSKNFITIELQYKKYNNCAQAIESFLILAIKFWIIKGIKITLNGKILKTEEIYFEDTFIDDNLDTIILTKTNIKNFSF